MSPKHPTLYKLSNQGRSLNLLFGRCRACGALSFPANSYGCSTCGAEDLETIERPGEGVVIAAVTLHAQVLPSLAVPQIIADVELAPGVTEEVLIDGDVAAGAMVYARAHALDEQTFDCRFSMERAS